MIRVFLRTLSAICGDVRADGLRAAARVRLLSIALAGLCAGLAGCGYSLGYRAPPQVRTIAVPMFNNETFPLRREVEYELTSALREEIQSRTGLRLTDEREADWVIHGTIRDFREAVIAEGPRDEKIEATVVITVRVTAEDFKNQRRQSESIRVQEPFSIELGDTLEGARRRAVGNLAERILLTIESWEENP